MRQTDIITKEERMMHYIIANLYRIQKLIEPYKQQRDILLDKEDGIWREDINKQYDKTIRSVIVTDMCQNLPITVLDGMVFVESIDLSVL